MNGNRQVMNDNRWMILLSGGKIFRPEHNFHRSTEAMPQPSYLIGFYPDLSIRFSYNILVVSFIFFFRFAGRKIFRPYNDAAPAGLDTIGVCFP